MAQDPNYLPPEHRLAEIMKIELGIDIPPSALRMFIRAKWGTVSMLANAIHGVEPGPAAAADY